MADTTPTLREAAQQALEALTPLANATTPAEREALTDADAQAADAASCDLRAALAEQAASALLERAVALHEEAGMPWDDAETLALHEFGVGADAIAELVGECTSSRILVEGEITAFAISVLVHGSALLALADAAALAEQAAEQVEPKSVWRCVGADDSMRRPEECDLVGGETDMPAEPVAGFRLLPSRLTNEMRAAMIDAARAYMARTGGNSPDAMYDAAVAAAPPAPARQEWQPIETAPKTGAKIIVRYVNRNNKPRTVMARWLTDEQAEETDADGVGLKGGWYECIDNWDDYTEVAIHEGEPSLWMPLPAAPITAAPAEGGA